MSQQMDKVCMVCGDKALGYNFNAVTCESCKAFFRRNALSSKDLSCPFNETCKITVVTRRFCQRCRLQKCFQIGMRKEYIMTEEDKLLKRKKVEENRAKRKSKKLRSDGEESINMMEKKEVEHQINGFWVQEHMMDANQMEMSPESSNSECLTGFQSIPNLLTNNPTSSNNPTILSSVSQYSTQIRSHQQMRYQTTESSIPINNTTINNTLPTHTNYISSTTNNYQMNIQTMPTQYEYPTKDSSTGDIVNFFLDHPSESSNYINVLMPNQKIAMDVITRIIQTQRDAIKLIGHLIGCPGDALKIISKIMNSPYHSLTVFAKFIGSPTDALEIIAKCVNSPNDVLQFIQQLMATPDNSVEIVNKFINAPGEAMKMLNDMVDKNEMIDIAMVDSPTITKMDNNDLSNLMAQSESMSDVSQIEIMSNDIITNTLYYTKNISSPTVRNLLQSTHGEASRNNTKITIPSDDKCENTTNTQPKTLESIINDAIKIEYNWNGKDSNNNRELNNTETAKLNELIVSYKALLLPLDADLTPLMKDRNDSSAKVLIHLFFI